MRWPWRRRLDAELDEEIRFHLEVEAEEQRRAGLSPREARDAAHRYFGNVGQVKEITRQMWGWNLLTRIRQARRSARRTLARTPAFAATAILSLALGIGANVASF